MESSLIVNIFNLKQKDSIKISKERTPPPTANNQQSQASNSTNPTELTGVRAAVTLYHDLTVFSNYIPTLYPKVLEPIIFHLDDDKKKLIHVST